MVKIRKRKYWEHKLKPGRLSEDQKEVYSALRKIGYTARKSKYYAKKIARKG